MLSVEVGLAVEFPVVPGVLHSPEAGVVQTEIPQCLPCRVKLELLFLLFAPFFDDERSQWGLYMGGARCPFHLFILVPTSIDNGRCLNEITI